MEFKSSQKPGLLKSWSVVYDNTEEDQMNHLKLSVNDSREKPFYCEQHGYTYEPCWHWDRRESACSHCELPIEQYDCDLAEPGY